MFKGCDVVFICTPVNLIYHYACLLAPIVGKNCVISDVGSTKGHIYDEMKNLGDSITYIGGHPMAGSERFRYNASKEHLFENAYYIITPAEGTDEAKTLEFKEMLEKRTGLPVVMWDERLTTMAADRTLEETGVHKEDRKQYLDQVAAVFILQGYLDAAAHRREQQ